MFDRLLNMLYSFHRKKYSAQRKVCFLSAKYALSCSKSTIETLETSFAACSKFAMKKSLMFFTLYFISNLSNLHRLTVFSKLIKTSFLLVNERAVHMKIDFTLISCLTGKIDIIPSFSHVEYFLG